MRTLETQTGHEVKLAFPPGPRRRGSGRLISIQHPHGRSNPKKCGCSKSKEVREALKVPRGANRERPKLCANCAARARVGKGKLCKFCQAPRKNPDEQAGAIALYKKFHGRDPKEVIKVQQSSEERKDYAVIGPLEDMKIEGVNGQAKRLSFHGDQVLATAAPGGKQIYFIGGNQQMSNELLRRFGTDASKDLVELGAVIAFCYWAAKKQSSWKVVPWEHQMGEDSGERPTAFYDKLKKRVFWIGGTYRIDPNWVMN